MIITSYQNGNTQVEIHSDGTKIRSYPDTGAILEFPESIDVKITNYCDMGCLYCHEVSTVRGLPGDLDKLEEVLKELPAGVELAIGGGNPLSHYSLDSFLNNMTERGLICNITVNQGHLKESFNRIIKLIESNVIKGIGISITNEEDLLAFNSLSQVTPHIVAHLIVGINSLPLLNKIRNSKILLLGYKEFGLGKAYTNSRVIQNIQSWNKTIKYLIPNFHFSFDNLAIEQLDIKNVLSPEAWDKLYMGDDFTHSMYIDAVNQEFAPTSRSPRNERNKDLYRSNQLKQYFREYHK